MDGVRALCKVGACGCEVIFAVHGVDCRAQGL